MNQLLSFLSRLGINLNISEDSSPVVLFAFSILVLSLIALMCIFTIIIQLLVLHVSSNEKLLERIQSSKYSLLLKLFNIYKQTRIYTLVIELLFLICCLSSIIWLCWRVIFGLIT